MALIKTNIIKISCDRFLCGYTWEGTQEEYDKALAYDGDSLNHFPTKRIHKECISLKANECPGCKAREERSKNPPKEEFKRGGVIPTFHDPYHNHRRKNI